MNTIIKFWANGCGNCKAMTPIIDAVKADFPNISFKDVNTADADDLVEKYEVTSLPTLVYLKDDKFVGRLVGLKPKSLVVKKIAEVF